MGTCKSNKKYLDSSQKYFMGTCKSNEKYLEQPQKYFMGTCKSNEENFKFSKNIWGIGFFQYFFRYFFKFCKFYGGLKCVLRLY